jgi:hypothetical protein
MKFPRHQFKKAWEWRKDLEAKKITSTDLTKDFLKRAKADTTN